MWIEAWTCVYACLDPPYLCRQQTSVQHLRNREIREKLYRGFVARASAGDFDNAPIIQRIMQIKMEMAKMLGCV